MKHEIPPLMIGQQLWFWLSTVKPKDGPPLFLSSVKKDPTMQELTAKVLQQYKGSDGVTGTAIVGSDRKMVFSAQNLKQKSLENLSKWLGKYSADYPGWEQLAGARFFEIDDFGAITAIYEDETLWMDLAIPTEPGTPEAVALALTDLQDDESAWFWFGKDSDEEQVVVSPLKNDPEAKLFMQQVIGIAEDHDFDSISIRGVLRNMKNGWALTTPEPIGDWCEDLKAWLANADKKHALPADLKGLKIVVQGDNALENILCLNKGELGSNSQIGLAAQKSDFLALEQGKELLFWFSKDQGVLCLSEDKASLKQKAKPHLPLSREHQRGKVQNTSKGFVVFRSKTRLPDVFLSLVDWYAKHIETHPFIQCIWKARFIHVDNAGNPIDRYKNDDVWR